MHAHTRGNECAQVSLALSSSRDHHRLILFFSNRLSIGSGVAVVVLVVSRNVVLVPFGIAVKSNSIVPIMIMKINYCYCTLLTKMLIQLKLVIVPNLNGKIRQYTTFSFTNTIKMILRQIRDLYMYNSLITFFVTTICFSAGKYWKGNTNL